MLQANTPVLVLPENQPATVRSVECNGQAVEVAHAGDSVDIVLLGLPDEASVGPGSVVSHPRWRTPVASKLTARVAALDVPMPILTGQPVRR